MVFGVPGAPEGAHNRFLSGVVTILGPHLGPPNRSKLHQQIKLKTKVAFNAQFCRSGGLLGRFLGTMLGSFWGAFWGPDAGSKIKHMKKY